MTTRTAMVACGTTGIRFARTQVRCQLPKDAAMVDFLCYSAASGLTGVDIPANSGAGW
jgi:hypothetical protein